VSRVAGYELEDLLTLRDLSRAEVRDRFAIPDSGVDPDVAYERITGVDRLHEPGAFPGHFYFRADDLTMIYIPRTALGDTDLGSLQRALGEPAATLRSRTGEDSSLLVYPARGVAFATDGEKVEIVEVFPPTTLEEYTAGIYKDPGEFIR
jgi:hypothetical protein